MLDLFVKYPDPTTSHQALTNFIGSQSQTASSTIYLFVMFFKSLHCLSLLHIDLCLKIRFRSSSVTTLSSNNIFLEVPRSKKLAFYVSAPKPWHIWNSLQNTIKDVSSLIDTFKTQLKSYFISIYHVFCNFALFCLHFLVFILILFAFCIVFCALHASLEKGAL